MARLTKFIKIKGSWSEVLDDCRFTVNKPDLNKEPSDAFKRKILIGEHSPIRDLIFKWEWLQIPHCTVVHYVRHKWEKFVGTQRPDRTGVSRPSQDDPQNMRGEGNTQHLIDTWRKRLCLRASKNTRDLAIDFKHELHTIDPFIADVLVPNCIYRGGCCEYTKDDPNRCRFYDTFLEKANKSGIDISDIQSRYDFYNNEIFKYEE